MTAGTAVLLFGAIAKKRALALLGRQSFCKRQLLRKESRGKRTISTNSPPLPTGAVSRADPTSTQKGKVLMPTAKSAAPARALSPWNVEATAAAGPLLVQCGDGKVLRIDAAHRPLAAPAGQLSWTTYVMPVPAAMKRRASSPQSARRRRFYPAQWRRVAAPTISRLVEAHGESLEWIGWDRSLPRLYLSVEQLTRAVVDLLQAILDKTDHSRGGRSAESASSAPAGPGTIRMRATWQSGATQALVIAIEHPHLPPSRSLVAATNGPLSDSFANFDCASHEDLVRVRSAVDALGGSLEARPAHTGGTVFRLSVPVDDCSALVRAWLDQISRSGSLAARRSLFIIGRRQRETLEQLDAVDARLQQLAGRGALVYRAARGRWLWLTTVDSLPGELVSDAWHQQLVGRWSPANSERQFHTSGAQRQTTVATADLVRAILARMDFVLGRRVPPLDSLDAPRARSAQRRIDRGVASTPLDRARRPLPHLARKTSVEAPLAHARRWRYPI